MHPAELLHRAPSPNRAASDAFWRRLHGAATEPYRAAGRFAWHYARGKLGRVRDALQPHGRLLLRLGDMDDALGFRISPWVDKAVTWVRGHRAPPTWGRTVAQWSAALQGLGFRVHAVPMSTGTPFANVLLVADL